MSAPDDEVCAATPLSRITIDWGHGERVVQGAAWSVTRALSTDLPEQLRTGVGIGAATARVTVAPEVQTPGEHTSPTVVGVETAEYQEAGPGTVLMAMPAGVVDGDVLIAFHSSNTDDADMGEPTGSGSWTTLFMSDQLNSDWRVWHRIAESEPAQVGFPVNPQVHSGGIIALVAVTHASPAVPVIANRLFNEQSESFSTPGATPDGTLDYLELRFLSGTAFESDVTWTVPDGFEIEAELDSPVPDFNGVLTSRVISEAGNTGDHTFRGEGSGTAAHTGNVLQETVITSGTNWTFSFDADVAAGTQLFGSITMDAAGGFLPVLTVTDSAGNTWDVITGVIAGSTVSTHLISSSTTNALTTVDQLNVTSNLTRSRVAVSVDAFSGIYDVGSVLTATNTGASANPEVGPLGADDGVTRLMFAGFGFGLRTFAPDAPLSSSGEVCTAAGSANRCGANAWVFDGEMILSGTLSSSSTYSAVGAAIEVPGSSVPIEMERAIASTVVLTHHELQPSELDCTPIPGHWSPFKSGRPSRVDRDVIIQGSYDPENFTTVFTGRTTRATGGTSDPELQLQCVDLSTRLMGEVDLPAISADADPTPGGYAPGLNALWVIDNLFRSGGFNLLVPTEPQTTFSATFMGSAQPEVYRADSTLTEPYPYSATNFAGNDVTTFEETEFAPLAVNDMTAVYGIESTSMTTGGGITVYFYVDWDESASGAQAVITLLHDNGDASTRIILDGDTQGITVDNGTGSGGTRTSPGNGLHVIAMRFSAAVDNIAARVFFDNTQIGAPIIITGTDPDSEKTSLRITTNGVPIGGVQVLDYETLEPFPAFDHVANAELTASLNTLVGTPGVTGQSAWRVLQEIVAAELGGVWIDEDGKAVFRNRDSMRGAGAEVIDVTAARSINEIQWLETIDHVYGTVQVPYQPLMATPNVEVYRASSVQRMSLGQVITRTVVLSDPAIGVTLNTRVNLAPDGSGGDLGPVTILSEELVNNVTFRFSILSQHGAVVYLVEPNGDPGIWITAQFAMTEGNAELVEEPAAPNNDRTLQISDNPWRQVVTVASGTAQFLASQVTEPLPILTRVAVRPQYGIRLGDVINLIDPVYVQVDQLALVAGVTLTAVAGGVTQDLVVRPLEPTWAQFDAAWAAASPNTWADFDALWAGFTWDDFDADPLRTT